MNPIIYDPESNRQSLIWVGPNSEMQRNLFFQKSQVKTLLVAFSNSTH